ncbi:peptidoglycan bridge formation glycyltransferase FemA/FemB family protein, partial [Staphylococcus aureus]|uniref:peptidoglycan bridge formation glycyltransferase FemA/FemB family protein n=1 Tax=Staphylococcus aureus TaxID=1280 RepID=UPI000B14204C
DAYKNILKQIDDEGIFIPISHGSMTVVAPKDLEKVSFTQSAIHYNHRVDLKGDVHLVGVKDDNGQVIAGCLLTEARTLKLTNQDGN